MQFIRRPDSNNRMWSLVVAALLGLISLSQAAFGLDPMGQAIDVDQVSTIEPLPAHLTFLSGDDLYAGQIITTGPDGQVQILFKDQTKMVIGPNSQLKLEEYLLRADNSVVSFAVGALRGTFRFIAGESEAGAYVINLPVGGIRGLVGAFDFYIDPVNGNEVVWMLDGAAEICDQNGECVLLQELCSFGALSPAFDPMLFEPESSDMVLSTSDFPYVWSQRGLRHDFRLPVTFVCAWMHRLDRPATFSGIGLGAEPRERERDPKD